MPTDQSLRVFLPFSLPSILPFYLSLSAGRLGYLYIRRFTAAAFLGGGVAQPLSLRWTRTPPLSRGAPA